MDKLKRVLSVTVLNVEAFTCCLFVFMFATGLPGGIHSYVGGYAKLAAIWGGIIFIYDMARTRRFLRIRYWYLLVAYFVLSAVSIIVNRHTSLYDQLSQFVYSALIMLCVFPYYATIPRERLMHSAKRVFTFFLALTTVTSLISVIMFFADYSAMLGDSPIGISEGRLFGIYRNPNGGALYALFSIVISGTMWYLRRHTAKLTTRIIYLVISAIQFLYLIFTDSKGAYVTGLVFMALITFYFIFLSGKINLSKQTYRWLIGIVTALVMVGITIAITYAMQKIVLISRNAMLNIPDDGEIGRENGYIFGSGRFDIWRVGYEFIKQKPLFGNGGVGLLERALAIDPKYFATGISAGMHNVYLQIAVAKGIPALLAFLAFIILTIIAFFKKVSAQRGARAKVMFAVVVALFIAMLADNLIETNIAEITSGIMVMFWIVLGIGERLTEPDELAHTT